MGQRIDRLRIVVEQRDTPGGRRFDAIIRGLIVLSLISFSIETLPGLSPRSRQALEVVEATTVVVFTGEYVVRLLVARSRRRYATSLFGIVDLASILPFYLTAGLDLRALRALRLLRIFRALKLLRFNAAIHRFHQALLMVREELILFFSAAALLLYLAGVGIYYFERTAQPDIFRSVFDGLWWAVVTLTTVGYGDAFPVTVGGRLFTFGVLMIGLGMVAVPTGILASALAEARENQQLQGTEVTQAVEPGSWP